MSSIYSLRNLPDNQTVSLGRYSVTWSRSDPGTSASPPPPPCTSTFDLPVVKVCRTPLYVRCSLPAYGVLRSPVTAVYTFYNRTDQLQEYLLVTEPSDAFMFSGEELGI